MSTQLTDTFTAIEYASYREARKAPLWTPYTLTGQTGFYFQGENIRQRDGYKSVQQFPYCGPGAMSLDACHHAIVEQKNKVHRIAEGTWVPSGRRTGNKTVALPTDRNSRVIRTDDTVVIPRTEYADLIRKAALYDHLAQ